MGRASFLALEGAIVRSHVPRQLKVLLVNGKLKSTADDVPQRGMGSGVGKGVGHGCTGMISGIRLRTTAIFSRHVKPSVEKEVKGFI